MEEHERADVLDAGEADNSCQPRYDPELEVTVLEMPRSIAQWYLVHSFLLFRKRVFIDELRWPIPSFGDIEYEQYDTFDAVYIVAHRGGNVCGGARLRRTDSWNGKGSLVYSYMIRDAHLGLLPGMPKGLCYEVPPQDPSIWELTRLVTSRSYEVTKAILHRANAFLAEEGASECYFLGWPSFMRMAQHMGYSPRQLGPRVANADGDFVAFSCSVVL